MNEINKISHLEGLRGISASIVVLSHLQLAFYAASPSDIRSALDECMPYVFSRTLEAAISGLYNGAFSVWLFWIMSAFVLSVKFFTRSNDITGENQLSYLKDAALRRYPRLLLPVLSSVLIAYALYSLGYMSNVKLSHLLGEPYESGWLSSFYTFPQSFPRVIESGVWQSFFAFDMHSTYNAVLWSMEKEMYRSLFLFAFLATLGNRKCRFIAYPLFIIINLSLGLAWLNAFVAGIVLCDIFVNRNNFNWIQLFRQSEVFNWMKCSRKFNIFIWILIVIAAGFGRFYLVIGTVAIALSLISPFTQNFLSGRIPIFLGKISFGIYLIHLPVICSFSSWAYLESVSFLGSNKAAFLVSVVTFGISVLLGFMFYLLFDKPAIHMSRWFSHQILKSPCEVYPLR